MTTRLGADVIVVLPYLWAIVTGKALLAGALVEPEPGSAASGAEPEEPQAADGADEHQYGGEQSGEPGGSGGAGHRVILLFVSVGDGLVRVAAGYGRGVPRCSAQACHRAAYGPPAARSSSWVPLSTMRPSSMTTPGRRRRPG